MADQVNVDLAQAVTEIIDRARLEGVDPLAALSIAKYESGGFSGKAGDNDTSFGPFQLHFGGGYPANAPHDVHGANLWAWSPAGIDYALHGIGAVASGQTGPTAIASISRQFEKPVDPATEIATATGYYNTLKSIQPPVLTSTGHLASGGLSAIATAGSGSASDKGSADLGTVNAAAGNPVGAAKDAINAIPDALHFLFSYRFLEVLGGGILIIVGVVGLMREVGVKVPGPPIPALPGGADRALMGEYEQGRRQGEAAAARQAGRKQAQREGTGPRKVERVELAADAKPRRTGAEPRMSDSIPF
jgi:hypothetical protein